MQVYFLLISGVRVFSTITRFPIFTLPQPRPSDCGALVWGQRGGKTILLPQCPCPATAAARGRAPTYPLLSRRKAVAKCRLETETPRNCGLCHATPQPPHPGLSRAGLTLLEGEPGESPLCHSSLQKLLQGHEGAQNHATVPGELTGHARAPAWPRGTAEQLPLSQWDGKARDGSLGSRPGHQNLLPSTTGS